LSRDVPRDVPSRENARFYRVDFRGYPSNQFSGYRLNGQIIKMQKKSGNCV
jgi:hypothetical protein